MGRITQPTAKSLTWLRLRDAKNSQLRAELKAERKAAREAKRKARAA